MSKVQTNNSYFIEKVLLRIEAIKNLKGTINVLDCFSGEGLLWDAVQKRTNKQINTLRIDKKNHDGLIGDNLKFLPSLNLNEFQIIDLDAYGVPYSQLKEIFNRNYKGIIICTFIQTMNGRLNKKMLNELGYTKEMINKIPSLFNKDGLKKISQFLNRHGINQIAGYFIERKNYFYFELK